MARGDIHNFERYADTSFIDWEEHQHVGGDDTEPGFKYTYAPPMAYKAFPSLASGFTYHALAPVGTASGASAWRLFRETKVTGTIEWANGNANWVNDLGTIDSLSYS